MSSTAAPDQAASTAVSGRIVALTLDETSIWPASAEAEHERLVAVADLLAGNSFQPNGAAPGQFAVKLGVVDERLVFDISHEDGTAILSHRVALAPFHRVIRDYRLVCESYYGAIRSASAARIEAIDMGRRGLHDEGSELLAGRLQRMIEVDAETARRLFTLLCALYPE